jgi:hypothetical protein
MKIACYQPKNRHEDQWARIEDPKTNPHSCGHLILDKGAQAYIGERTASSVNGTGKTGYLHAKDWN